MNTELRFSFYSVHPIFTPPYSNWLLNVSLFSKQWVILCLSLQLRNKYRNVWLLPWPPNHKRLKGQHVAVLYLFLQKKCFQDTECTDAAPLHSHKIALVFIIIIIIIIIIELVDGDPDKGDEF